MGLNQEAKVISPTPGRIVFPTYDVQPLVDRAKEIGTRVATQTQAIRACLLPPPVAQTRFFHNPELSYKDRLFLTQALKAIKENPGEKIIPVSINHWRSTKK